MFEIRCEFDDQQLILRGDADGARHGNADSGPGVETLRVPDRNAGAGGCPLKKSQGILMRYESQIALNRVSNRQSGAQPARNPFLLS